jgi:hypothetical protein
MKRLSSGRKFEMDNHCGTCTACCRVFAIPEFNKSAGKWCDHCNIGVGCNIYDARPNICRDFQCLWLLSQEQDNPNEKMPLDMRPDKSKVVFSATTRPDIMSATTLPDAPFAWKQGNVFKLIKLLTTQGYTVAIGPPVSSTRTVVRFELGKFIAREVEMTEPDENGIQWSKEK